MCIDASSPFGGKNQAHRNFGVPSYRRAVAYEDELMRLVGISWASKADDARILRPHTAHGSRLAGGAGYACDGGEEREGAESQTVRREEIIRCDISVGVEQPLEPQGRLSTGEKRPDDRV
mgnify:CR=1 FL=1